MNRSWGKGSSCARARCRSRSGTVSSGLSGRPVPSVTCPVPLWMGVAGPNYGQTLRTSRVTVLVRRGASGRRFGRRAVGGSTDQRSQKDRGQAVRQCKDCHCDRRCYPGSEATVESNKHWDGQRQSQKEEEAPCLRCQLGRRLRPAGPRGGARAGRSRRWCPKLLRADVGSGQGPFLLGLKSISRLYRDLPFHPAVVVAGLVTADENCP